MRSKFKILIAVICLVTFWLVQAGPLTNKSEYDGDKKMSKADHQKYESLLNEGVSLFDNGDYVGAEKKFAEIIGFAPHKNLAHFNFALSKYKQGDYKAAIESFDKVIKKRSYYVGAAFYYKAISQLNLGLESDAVKTAKRFTPARFFYGPSQSLIKSIQNGTDEFYENAKLALADENFELCLVELEESVFADTTKGKDLHKLCSQALSQPEGPMVTKVIEKELENRYRFWLDGRLKASDNIFGEGRNQVARTTYNFEVGAEYVFRGKIDYGFGVSYEHENAIDLPNYKDELISLYMPFFYRDGAHRYSAQAFYNHSKFVAEDVWSETGMFLNYLYTQEKYSFGLIGTLAKKTDLTSAFEYKNGTFSNLRLNYNRFFGPTTLGFFVGFDQTMAGDQNFGVGVLPYSNKALRGGVTGQHNLDSSNSFYGRITYADKDYLNVYSANGTDRQDKATTGVLGYQYRFSRNARVYIEQAYVRNNSNYGDLEIVNKDFTENTTTLGVSLVSFN